MPGSSARGDDDKRLVNRLKHSNPAKFEELVKLHLSFLLALPGANLEEFMEPPKPSKAARLLSKSKKRLGWEQHTSKAREGSVFGKVLSAEPMEPILAIIRHLHQAECLSEVGLFRKNGSERRKRTLMAAINRGDMSEVLDTAFYNVHDLADVVKLYVKELPEPLLTHKLNMAYCQILEFNSQDKKLRTVQLLTQLLPKENYILLQYLLTLLNAVPKNPISRMTFPTLGLLFAPHVVESRPTEPEQLLDDVKKGEHTELMAFLIEHSAEIFKLPEQCMQDVRSYWQRMEQTGDAVDFTSSSNLAYADPSEDGIQSCVSFTDRKASAAGDDYTQMQLAQLCAHIGSMPDGARKRRFAKQVTAYNGTTTPSMNGKHKRSKSIGESLKKLVGRSQPRRRAANHSSSVSSASLRRPDSTFSPVVADEPQSRRTMIPGPVQNLFRQSEPFYAKAMNTPGSRQPVVLQPRRATRR